MNLAERIDMTRDLRELWALACERDRLDPRSDPSSIVFEASNCYAARYNELLAQRWGLHAISGVRYAVIADATPPRPSRGYSGRSHDD